MHHPANESNPYPSSILRLTAIRLVKSAPGVRGAPAVAFESEAAIRLLRTGVFAEESQSDYLFFIEHEEYSVRQLVFFRVRWPGVAVKHVLFERKELEFRQEGDDFLFEIDLNGLRGRSLTLDVHSHLFEPGLDIRVEHNDRLRSSGRFHTIPWPQRQIDAATHYIFASREALKSLGIPSMLAERNGGYVALMGFETCNPYHDDFPPHWHLIYRWENTAGSQAPHIYMDELGNNTHNKVTIDRIPRVQGHYEAEEWCFFKNEFGHDVFAMKVCRDGGVAIAKPESAIFKLTPYDPERGVEVYAGSERVGAVQVKNDTTNGRMRIHWLNAGSVYPASESYEEIIAYEPLLGDTIDTVRTDFRESNQTN